MIHSTGSSLPFTSDDGDGPDAQRFGELDGFFFDLLRQLSGRRHDDAVRTAFCFFEFGDLR